ncbi:MAG: septum site-determining protein MinC [Anaerolineaceae bacterium]|nr:septum site-determining protein MinC [Anaerolineaceae bacterium]
MAPSTSSIVQIKGIREGILATLGEGEWPDMQQALLRQVGEGNNFFQGARLALDVGARALHAVELGALRDILSERGISLWAVIGSSQVTETTAQVLGMATRLSTPRPERTVHVSETNLPGDSTVLVQRTLRSGYRLAHPGHIVVVGDVNPGAEICAGGSVVVWGHLRGAVHAGANGDLNATVSALDLAPTQIRIAEVIGVVHRRRGKSQPETARVNLDHVIIESWNSKTK